MHPLYQQLKDLDANTFERFCFHLLKERHPGIDIRHVEGKGGDEGIDIFSGDLSDGPTVWQCKAFPDGVRAAQKVQIRESLARAIRSCAPKKWILCINVDLDSKAFRWYQMLERQQKGVVELGLLQASDIVSQLVHYQTLCKAFFPAVTLDVDGLRALITGTGKMTDGELESLTEENMDQLLLRMKDRDARFNYEITYSRDRVLAKPEVSPGEVFSFMKGPTTIRAFARDQEALRASPPKVHLKLQQQGAEKIKEFLKKGFSQDISPGEIVGITTDLPLSELIGQTPETLTLRMTQHSRESIALRLVFGSGAHSIVYEYVVFRVARVGTEEAELVSTGSHPFTMSMVIRDNDASVNLTEHPLNAEVRSVRNYMDAMHAIEATHRIECYDLAKSRRLFRAETGDIRIPQHWVDGFERLVRDSAAIADAFGTELFLPPQLAEADMEALIMLKAIMSETPVSITAITLEVVKSAENEDSLAAALDKGIADVQCRMEEYRVVLFGVAVPVGSVELNLGSVPIQDAQGTRKRWLNAKVGDAVGVRYGPTENAIYRKR
jgi:hypothetical protein